jgi:hypothetical protein
MESHELRLNFTAAYARCARIAKKKARPLPGRASFGAAMRRGGYLLLRLVLRSPCWLPRLLLLPREALPRSLGLLLLPLRLLPLRLLLPLDALLRPLPEEDDFELPDFMVNAPWLVLLPAPHAGRKSTLGRALRVSVGRRWPSM